MQPKFYKMQLIFGSATTHFIVKFMHEEVKKYEI